MKPLLGFRGLKLGILRRGKIGSNRGHLCVQGNECSRSMPLVRIHLACAAFLSFTGL